jgi:hypothetical protein
MEAHSDAPGNATHWFALLVGVAPKDTAKPGEIEKAYGDSWVGRDGCMRAFIGKVRNEDGKTYEESLFVVDVPDDVDITTADAGSAKRFPSPPKGLRIRRLTRDWAGGIVRGTPDGDRIAYYGKAGNGTTQVFVIPSDGSDRNPDPSKRPMQVTHVPGGVESSLRWHPSGDHVACIAGNAVMVTCVKPGPDFGRMRVLTRPGLAAARSNLVWSPDGSTLAYNMPVPSYDKDGKRVRTYDGRDCLQIFVVRWCP